MARDFLQLWHHTTADRHLAERYVLGHAGSEQFYRVRPDDTVWAMTVYPPGELVLLGRLRVGECKDLEGAKRRLGTDDVWEASYHVIAKPGSAEALREVDLTRLAGELRFRSKVNDRLDVTDGFVRAQQLQTMRELTSESATLLEEIWSVGTR
jgi:hypothetical protein